MKITFGQRNNLVLVMFLVSAISFAALYFDVYAQENRGVTISISPLTFELNAKPGDKFTNIVKVYNGSDVSISIGIEVENFVPQGEKGEVVIDAEENTTYSLKGWVSVSPETFTVEPKKFQAVEFVVKVPSNAEPGGHYGTILAGNVGAIEGGGAALAQKIGSLLLVQVAGELKEQLSLESFEAPEFSHYGPITFISRFKNNGTVHLKPRGFVLIKNIFGREVTKLDLPQQNVLPGAVRRIETLWDKKNLFGRYDAVLTAIYGSTNEPISAVTTFYVIPVKKVAIIGGISFVVLVLLIRGRRRIGLALSILLRGEGGARRHR